MEQFTHLDEAGAARMVDVSGKDVTARSATATGKVLVSPAVVELLRGDGVPKGDALGVARVAGIMAAKRTPDLVPLCHPLSISGVTIDLEVHDDGVAITATVKTADRTGVEMEALTAVSVAAPKTPCAVVNAPASARIFLSAGSAESADWSAQTRQPVSPFLMGETSSLHELNRGGWVGRLIRASSCSRLRDAYVWSDRRCRPA